MSTDVQLLAPAPVEQAPTCHVLSRKGVATELHVEPERGLTAAEAGERLRRDGPNKFAEAKPEPRWRAFVRQYDDPMQIVLLVAGIISIYPVKQAGTGIVMLLLTILNAILGLNQEGKAAAAVAALAKMMIIKARVRRDGATAQVPADQLVPGDVVAVEAGDSSPPTGGCWIPRIAENAGTFLDAVHKRIGLNIDVLRGDEARLAAVRRGLRTYDPDEVHGTVLDVGEIDRQIALLRARDATARAAIPGLQPARADVILAGACIVRAVVELPGGNAIVVSDRGLRHGVLAERFAAHDPLMSHGKR